MDRKQQISGMCTPEEGNIWDATSITIILEKSDRVSRGFKAKSYD